jgi:hypothetical protein
VNDRLDHQLGKYRLTRLLGARSFADVSPGGQRFAVSKVWWTSCVQRSTLIAVMAVALLRAPSSQAAALLMLCAIQPGACGRRPKRTQSFIASHHGSSLQGSSGRQPMPSAEQVAQENMGDGNLEYHISQRAHILRHLEEETTGLLVTEAPGSLWVGTGWPRKVAEHKAGHVLLAIVMFLAVLSNGGSSGASTPGPTPYTLAEARTAQAWLSALGRSILIEGDGPYTIRLWPHADDASQPLTQPSACAQGGEVFPSQPELSAFVGSLSNARGTQRSMILDLFVTSATEAKATLAAELIAHPQTTLVLTVGSLEGCMIQVPEGALQAPPYVPSDELPSASQENVYVFLVRITDRALLPRTAA